jgi:hypothetical protein
MAGEELDACVMDLAIQDVWFWTQGHVLVVLAFDDGGPLPHRPHGLRIAPLDGNGERGSLACPSRRWRSIRLAWQSLDERSAATSSSGHTASPMGDGRV